MTRPMEGIRIIEVAAWTFVPVAGAMLADMGADVIKVEPPSGDPQRGLHNMVNMAQVGPNAFNEIPNRGKRSITLDLQNEKGREVLLKLCESADVFLTSYLPSVRKKLKVDVDDIRAANPNIIYARGSGWGDKGPMRDAGAYDLAAAWASSGLAHKWDQYEQGPPPMPGAFFDLQGGNTIAGAVGTALFHRERTGEAKIVDVSLMNVGMWAMSPEIISAPYIDIPLFDRQAPGNPVSNWYKTKDARWIYLVLLQADRFWPDFCKVLGREDLITDERYDNAEKRFERRREVVELLDGIFASKTLDEWKPRFEGFKGVWAPALKTTELHTHEQVLENDFLPQLKGNDGSEFRVVAGAMQFDGEAMTPRSAAPEVGQDTEMVLMDYGVEWEDIEKIREAGGFG